MVPKDAEYEESPLYLARILVSSSQFMLVLSSHSTKGYGTSFLRKQCGWLRPFSSTNHLWRRQSSTLVTTVLTEVSSATDKWEGKAISSLLKSTNALLTKVVLGAVMKLGTCVSGGS